VWPCKKSLYNKIVKKDIRVRILNGRDLWLCLEENGFARCGVTSRGEERAGEKSERNDCGKEENVGQLAPK
jgi:hypothetical protein